jgi:hypothetical protein
MDSWTGYIYPTEEAIPFFYRTANCLGLSTRLNMLERPENSWTGYIYPTEEAIPFFYRTANCLGLSTRLNMLERPEDSWTGYIYPTEEAIPFFYRTANCLGLSTRLNIWIPEQAIFIQRKKQFPSFTERQTASLSTDRRPQRMFWPLQTSSFLTRWEGEEEEG